MYRHTGVHGLTHWLFLDVLSLTASYLAGPDFREVPVTIISANAPRRELRLGDLMASDSTDSGSSSEQSESTDQDSHQHSPQRGYDTGDFYSGAGSPQPLSFRGFPVAVLPCQREVHFVQNLTYSTGVTRVTSQRFAFIGLRLVRFLHCQVLTGWCSDPDCPDAGAHAAEVLSGSDFAGTEPDAFFQGTVRVCSRAQALADAWGGWQSSDLQQLRQSCRPAEPGQLQLRPVDHCGDEALAVLPGHSTFQDWAILLQHANGSGWFCSRKDCANSHSCRHMLAANHASKHAHAVLSEATWEAKLAADFDIAAGKPCVLP